MSSKPVTTAATTTATQVTRIKTSLEITPPPGYFASVVLRLVGHSTAPPEDQFQIWVMAGRHAELATTVPYRFDGAFAVRIDLANGDPFSEDFLLAELKKWLAQQPNPPLPTDPPVIKHGQ